MSGAPGEYDPFDLQEPGALEDRPDDMPVNRDAADEDQHKKVEDIGKLQERQAKAFWRGVFATEVGRREAWKLLQGTRFSDGVIHRSGPNGAPDHYATQYYQGQRDLGFAMFLRWCLIDREGVFTMLDEHDAAFMKAKLDA